MEDRAKVNEAAFPFNNPIASSFLFREAAENSQSSSPDAASRVLAERTTTALHKADSENDSELHFGGDVYHDPEDASITESEASPRWNSIRQHSFDYVREVAVGSSGLSSRALSRLLLIERSGMEITDGRFSVDLQRGQKLDKAMHPRTPDARLRVFSSEKSSKRSILSPCLVRSSIHCLHSYHFVNILLDYRHLCFLSTRISSFLQHNPSNDVSPKPEERVLNGEDDLCVCYSLFCSDHRTIISLKFNKRQWRHPVEGCNR